MYRSSFKAFGVRELGEYLEENNHKIRSHIDQEPEDYILSVDETEYVNGLVNKFTIGTPTIDFTSASVSSYEKQIPAERFPDDFNVRPGKSYPKQAVIYHLPYAGNADLFQYVPNQRLLWRPEVFIEDQYVCFEVVSLGENAEEIKQEAQEIIINLEKHLEYLTQEIKNYNAQLRANIEQSFKARKQKILKKNQMLISLGLPTKS